MPAPRFAGEGHVEPTMAKVGPKMGPRGLPELSWELRSLSLTPFGARLGPVLGYLGLGRLDLGVQGGQKLSFQKQPNPFEKSMFLAAYWGQRAFGKLAKWLFANLVVCLKP